MLVALFRSNSHLCGGTKISVDMTRSLYSASVLYISTLLINPGHLSCCAFQLSRSRSSFIPSSDSRGVRLISKNNDITKEFNRHSQLDMTTSGADPMDSLLDEKSTVADSLEEDKPNREYSIQILNAIEELKREDWNGLLDENSRYYDQIISDTILLTKSELVLASYAVMHELWKERLQYLIFMLSLVEHSYYCDPSQSHCLSHFLPQSSHHAITFSLSVCL